MSDTRRFNDLRSQYRNLWDAYQVVANNNVQLLHEGKKPTDKQLLEEKRALTAVENVRDELLAAIARLGQ